MATSLESLRVNSTALDANRARHKPIHVDECLLCGLGLTRKSLKSATWVELDTALTLIDPADRQDDEDSQGLFPIGPTCADRVPSRYRQRINGGAE